MFTQYLRRYHRQRRTYIVLVYMLFDIALPGREINDCNAVSLYVHYLLAPKPCLDHYLLYCYNNAMWRRSFLFNVSINSQNNPLRRSSDGFGYGPID
jgi:hypothetical protein